MRHVGLVRVSTEDQPGSIQAQTSAIRSFAPDAEIFIEDDVSGATPLEHRPQLL